MIKRLMLISLVLLGLGHLKAQLIPTKFGQGLQVVGKDSSYYMKLGLRFQNLYVGKWDVNDGELNHYQSNFLVRRSRLKLNGWALSPKVKYKLEIGFSNRDNSGTSKTENSSPVNMILDAWVQWNFYKNFSVKYGQAKWPGNRERIISSANLQFVDRSVLNSRFNIDRDFGVQFDHHKTLGEKFIVKNTVAFGPGEGRNITRANQDGYAYAYKIEALPFGKFASKGDYVGSAIKREETPKLAVAFAYQTNQNSIRERGELGKFITDSVGNYHGETVHNLFVDAMFKYKAVSIMAEYAQRKAKDGTPEVLDGNDNIVGRFYTGNAFNIQLGYMMENNWEVAVRYTNLDPDAGVANAENQYTFGLSKFIVGHKLKFQTDLTYADRFNSENNLIWRTQFEVHF